MALVIVVSALAALKLSRSTVYFSHSSGFNAFSFGAADQPKPVDLERYKRILERFAKGDLFDSLWITHREGDAGGLTLTDEGSYVQMDVSFLAGKEADRLASFRKGMAARGLTPTTEEAWNVGHGPDLESVTLEYRFSRDLESYEPHLNFALEQLDGPAGDQVFVDAWRSGEGPTGTGIKIVPKRDLLSQVP